MAWRKVRPSSAADSWKPVSCRIEPGQGKKVRCSELLRSFFFVAFVLLLSELDKTGAIPVPRCMRKPVFSSPARCDEKANTKQRVLSSRAVAAIAAVVDPLCWQLLCLFCPMVCFLRVCTRCQRSAVLLARV